MSRSSGLPASRSDAAQERTDDSDGHVGGRKFLFDPLPRRFTLLRIAASENYGATRARQVPRRMKADAAVRPVMKAHLPACDGMSASVHLLIQSLFLWVNPTLL